MDYLAEANAKFETAFTALKSGGLTPDLHKLAQTTAHKIAGNALMYGYGELGDKARDLENMLKAGPDFDPALAQSLFVKLTHNIEEIRGGVSFSDDDPFESETFQPSSNPDRWKTDSIKTEDGGMTHHSSSVLLIHSDSWMSGLIAKMMEPEYKVTQCNHAHLAMADAVNETPDLIIIEQNLPDMSGIDVTKFIRNIPDLQSTPVIMIMSSSEPEDIVAAVEAGVTDCFETATEILPLVNHAKTVLAKTQNHVLIVDDDAAVRDLLKRRFETYGLKVDVVSDGIEALEYLRSKKPDLIILDRMMPRLEGGAVLYQIQQEINLKSIPVMLVTAMANRNDVITWLKRGAIDYITKPFNPDEVVLRALRHLRIEKDAA